MTQMRKIKCGYPHCDKLTKHYYCRTHSKVVRDQGGYQHDQRTEQIKSIKRQGVSVQGHEQAYARPSEVRE
jgi:hypothetical protein